MYNTAVTGNKKAPLIEALLLKLFFVIN